jgi:hypothetical protein
MLKLFAAVYKSPLAKYLDDPMKMTIHHGKFVVQCRMLGHEDGYGVDGTTQNQVSPIWCGHNPQSTTQQTALYIKNCFQFLQPPISSQL